MKKDFLICKHQLFFYKYHHILFNTLIHLQFINCRWDIVFYFILGSNNILLNQSIQDANRKDLIKKKIKIKMERNLL